MDMNHILVLGGLDSTHHSVCDFFTNYCFELKIAKFHKNDEMYVCTPKSAMQTGRGCFGVAYNLNWVFVFGGVKGTQFNQNKGKQDRVSFDIDENTETREGGLLSLCEKYDVENDQWYSIAELPIPLRNAGACSMSCDSVYLFGGKTIGPNGQAQLSD